MLLYSKRSRPKRKQQNRPGGWMYSDVTWFVEASPDEDGSHGGGHVGDLDVTSASVRPVQLVSHPVHRHAYWALQTVAH